ncbi:MAG: hypothetical protein ABSD78_12550 [Acidimicrobiales bacterium]|jgi:hypothetical protein
MLTESELGSRLSDELRAAVAVIVPSDEFVRTALSHRPRRRLSLPYLALGAIPVAASLAAALVLFAPTSAVAPHAHTRPANLTVRLLGHDVHLPKGDRLVSSSDSSCQAWLSSTRREAVN